MIPASTAAVAAATAAAASVALPPPESSPVPNGTGGARGGDGGATAADRSGGDRRAAGALQKQRSALRNWRSAAYDHALVLVGAARLPRKILAEAAKMPGAVWVDRHELGEPCSLPLEVKSVMAKSLAAQMPTCASCDDNESGRGESFVGLFLGSGCRFWVENRLLFLVQAFLLLRN